ncbi:sugar phosphate isomerase/epimerase, partial [Streptomyces violarus]|nr:sugar phosphate isomerase/epimerase [Streptomyces violarus]
MVTSEALTTDNAPRSRGVPRMSRFSQPDPELTHRLSRRGMLGVAAGATAAALLG